MKITTMVAIAAVAGMSAQAKQAGKGTGQRVDVYVYNDLGPLRALPMAEGLAAEMFLSAGVRIRWYYGGQLPAGAIAITLASQAPASLTPGTMALAFPYERVHVTLFLDRVLHANGFVLPPVLLAHVLVHEITHILQGIDRHSDSGVMKACWTAPDYEAMARKPLPFASDDVDLIHRGWR
jgi:hypothetical protein